MHLPLMKGSMRMSVLPPVSAVPQNRSSCTGCLQVSALITLYTWLEIWRVLEQLLSYSNHIHWLFIGLSLKAPWTTVIQQTNSTSVPLDILISLKKLTCFSQEQNSALICLSVLTSLYSLWC